MIKINVGPALEPDLGIKNLIVAGVVLLIVAAIGYEIPSYIAGSKKQEADDINSKIAEDTKKLDALRLQMDKIGKLNTVLIEKQRRQSIVKSLDSNRKKTVMLLDQIQRVHMERMWFSTLKIDGNKVSLVGFATDHSLVSEYTQQVKAVTDKLDLREINLKDFVPTFAEKKDATDPKKKPSNSSPAGTTLVGNTAASNAGNLNSASQNDDNVPTIHFTNVVLKRSENVRVGLFELPTFELEFEYE